MKLLRKILRKALWVAGGLLILVLLLHTPPARSLLRGILARFGEKQVNGQVEIGRLNYKLWRGSAELGDIGFKLRGLQLRAGRVKVAFFSKRGLIIEADKVRVTLLPQPESTPEKERAKGPSYPWSFLKRLGTVKVTDGLLEWKQGPSESTVSGSVTLERLKDEKDEDERNWSFRSRLSYQIVGRSPVPLEIEGLLGLEGESLRLNNIQLRSNENSLTASGVCRQARPLEGNIRGEVRADASLTEAFGLRLPVQGTIAGPFQLEAVDSALQGRVELASSRLMLAGTGPWTANAMARLQEKTVHVETVILRGYGGLIESQGRIDLAGGDVNVRLQANGMDLNSLALIWTKTLPPVATRAGAEVELSLENWQIAQAKGKAKFTFGAMPEGGIPLSGKVNLDLEKGRWHVLSEGLRIAEGSAQFKAALDKRGIDAQYDLKFPASGLQKILSTYRPGLPRLNWQGFLNASGSITGAFPDLSATASIKSEDLTVQTEKIAVGMELEWEKAGLLIHSAQVSSGPGNLKIQGALPLAGPAGQWELSGTMESFDLSAFVKRLGFSAFADGSLTVQGPAQDPSWTARLKVSLEDREKTSRQATISLEAHGQKEAVSLDDLKAEIGGGSLIASGSVRLDSKEISGRASGFGIQVQEVPGLPESLKKLAGILSLDGDLSGKPGTLQGGLRLDLDDLSLNGSPLPKQSFHIRIEDGQASFKGFFPQPFLSGSCRLRRPYALQANIDLSPLPYSELRAAFSALPRLKITSAAGGIKLNLNLEDISGLRWQADIDEIKGLFDKQEWKIAPFTIDGDRTSLRLSGFRFQGTHSSLSMGGIIPLTSDGTIDLKLDGPVGLEVLSIFFPTLEARGTIRLGLRIQGTRRHPVLEGELAINHGSGRFRGITWDDLELLAKADNNQARLETLSLRVLGGEVKASGNLSLSPNHRGSQVAFEWARLDAGLLLSAGSDASRPSILLSGKGRLSIPELRVSSLSGSGQLTEILTNIGNPPIALQKPVEWNLEKGAFAHSPLQLAGEKTLLNIALRASAADPRPEFDVRISGHFNTAAIGQFIPGSGVSFSEMTTIRLEIGQKTGALSGQLSLDGGRVQISNPPLSISQIQGQLSLAGRTLEVTSLKAKISSGSIEASGQLQFKDPGTPPQADLRFALEDLPLIPAEGIFSLVSGQLRLAGDSHKYALTGDIVVPRGFFRREMDAASESLSLINRQLNVLEGKPSLLDQIALNVKVQIRDFRIENSLAQLSAEGILSATGALSRPEIGGSISVDAGGSLNLGRAQITISDGRVVLDSYPEGPLKLEVGGFTRISGVYIDMRVQGPLDNLQTQLRAPYRSDLTQGDLAMLLMTGRTSQAAVSEAGVVAAEQLAGAVGDQLQKRAGESVYIDVSSDQSFFSYDTDPTTWFSLGKEVLPGFYVIYEKDLASTRQRVVFSYMPKEKPYRLRLIGEDDGRTMLELNHRLEIGLRASRDPGGKRPSQERIGQLSFEGKSPLDDRKLQKLIKLKPGKKYDAWAAQKDADKLQKELEKLGYRNARVEIKTEPSGPGKRKVIFLIDSGKRVLFVWKGDELGKKTRKAIESLWNATASEDILSETMARKAEYALRADRYYLARVTAERTTAEEEITVSLQVRKGPRGERLALRFRGNDVLSEKELAAALPPPSEPGFFEAIEGNASTLQNALRVRYAAEGYLQAEVKPVETGYNTETGEYLVTIPIDEGRLSLVEDIVLPPEVAGLPAPEGPDLQMRVGEPFRIEQYLHDRSALSRYYREQGYDQPRITGVLKPAEDKISVEFTLNETIRPRVRNIRLGRTGRTREDSVRNLVTLKEGDLILPTEVDRSRKRLFDTRVFKSVDIQAVESPGNPKFRDLVVDLVEKKEVELNYGLRYEIEGPDYAESSDSDNYSSLEVGGQLQLLNIFGRANRYGISGYLFGKQQSGRVFFETESFFQLPFPTQVYASTELNQELEISGLEMRIRKIAFQQYYRLRETVQGARWSERLRMQWNYSFRHIRLDYYETDLEPVDTDRGSVSLALIGDTRDSFINPSRGTFWSASAEFSRTWLGSDVDFNKLYGQFFWYVPLAKNVIWVTGLRLGVVPGENPFLIIEDRFKAGGPTTVRAFALNSLGPKNEKGEPLGGQAMAVFNQELRFPLYKSLQGGVFYDTGNVFLFASKMSLGDLRHCAGLGLRYLLPFGPVRLDWAYVLDPEPDETRYRFVFSLGHAF
jgi:outer membrane protein insertion porin family